MSWVFIILTIFTCSGAYSEAVPDRAFYSNFLFQETTHPNVSHKNFEGFIENVKNNIPAPTSTPAALTEIEKTIEKIHNILVKTFYECTANKPKALSFVEAVDGKHTPDSQHYASLLYSALYTKGITTDFFKTPTHYGIHYKEPKTGEELFWCIITPLAKKGAAKNKKAYVKIFNKYKNPKINGAHNIKDIDVKIISVEDFVQAIKG
jgi:hypothetical protein